MKDGFIKVSAATPKIKVADPAYNTEEILKIIDETEKNGAKMCIRDRSEAVTNCIVHAYHDPDGKISMDLSDQNGILRIEIKDQGIGIPDVKKAMEPMFTTKPEEERTGMGFSFMEAFMDQVEVISKQGEGTTVIMTKKIGDQDKLNG